MPDLLPEGGPALQSKGYLAALLSQEVSKYNSLIKHIQSRCQMLIACLDGESIMTAELAEECHDGIMCDRMPPQWSRAAYPCLSNLPDFLVNLQERVDYMHGLLEEDVEQLYRFWVPGFFGQRQLLSYLLQKGARAQQLPLDQAVLKYTVTSRADDAIDEGASREAIESKLHKGEHFKGGYYLYGLTCHGARWHRRMKFFDELPHNPGKLLDPMPAIHVEVVHKKDQGLFLCPTRLLEPPGALDPEKLIPYADNEEKLSDELEIISILKQAKKITPERHFRVPLYATSQRSHLPESMYGGLVTHMVLRVDNARDQAFWAKRAVALVCDVDPGL